MLGGTNSNSQQINNLDVTLTENGTFVSGPEYTGFGTVTVDVPPDVMTETLPITPTATDIINIPLWDEYQGPFTDSEGTQFTGAGNIRVRKVSSWIDSNISADNIRKGQTILGVSGNVIELLPQTKTARAGTEVVNVVPDSGYNALSKVSIQALNLERREHVVPKNYSQTIKVSSGSYDGMYSVQIEAVDASVDSNIKPGNIKKNVTILGVQGTYDNYPPLTTLTVTPSTETQTITPTIDYDGYTTVTVEPVTSAIDNNIKPENIKRDVEILGVVGTYRIENLQDKVVDPQPYLQTVTFDSVLGYEGLNSVTVNAVTKSVDNNIKPGNIKKDVTILGVEGTYDPQPLIQPTVTVEPSTLQQTVTPIEGYDGLGRVDIKAVTAAIDPNILAQNIVKNVNILGVEGTYEYIPNYQNVKTVEPTQSGDVEVTPDPTYEALLKVIVKAVTASIDPNIMPKNIRKNVSILGVLGTLEEGGGQKWFDFSDIKNFVELNQDTYSEGSFENIRVTANKNDYHLEQFINTTFPSIDNINAVMFTQVYGYDDEELTDDIVEQCYINFIGGYLYQEYSKVTQIEDQKRYLYPVVNNYNVEGLTLGLDNDDGSARVMKLYVITNSEQKYAPLPVLVNGDMVMGYLPDGYDGFRYIKDVQVPAHNVYIPKTITSTENQWVLRDENAVKTRYLESLGEPTRVEVSAYDRNYGETDNETDIVVGYKLKKFKDVVYDEKTSIVSQKISGTTGYIEIPTEFEKKDQSYYYFKFSPQAYWGYHEYRDLVWAPGLFWLGFYRYYDYSVWYPAWFSSWSSATAGSKTYNSSYGMYNGNIYYYRVYVNGTSTRIDWSSNGSTWITMATINNSFINPTTTNPIYLYSQTGPNTKFYAKDCYVLKNDELQYSLVDDILAKKTSHLIVPRDNDNLFVSRDTKRVSIKYQGDELFKYDSIDKNTKLLDMGTDGYIEIENGFDVNNKNWEIRQHFKVASKIGSSNRHLFTCTAKDSNSYRSCVWIDTSNKLHMRIFSSSTSTNFDTAVSDTQLIDNYEYYIRFGYTNSMYYVFCATDPDYDNTIISWTTNNTNYTYNETNNVLLGNWTKVHDTGSMRYLYLDEYTYVKVDDKLIWKPANKELYGNIVDYTDNGTATILDTYLTTGNIHKKLLNGEIVGNIQIDNNNAASNFKKSANYIALPSAFAPGTLPWEWVMKINMNEITGQIIGGTRACEEGIEVGFSNGKAIWWLGTQRYSYNIASGQTGTYTYLPNVDYWIKMSFNGSVYTLAYSLDGENYTTDISTTSSNTICGYKKVLGVDLAQNSSSFKGKIYLNDTYIKINNQLWWKPEVVTDYDYDWIFTNNPNWSISGLTNLGKKGTIAIPAHILYEWNQDNMQWADVRQLILNVNDPNAVLFAEII